MALNEQTIVQSGDQGFRVRVLEDTVQVISVGQQGPPGPLYNPAFPLEYDETSRVRLAPATVVGAGLIWNGTAWANQQIVPVDIAGAVPFISGAGLASDSANFKYDGASRTITVPNTVLGGTLTALTDNTFDIGASGAFRFRDLFLARNAVIGGTLNVGAVTSTVTNGVVISAPSSTTSYVIGQFANSFGNMVWGVEGNVSGGILTGTTPYAVVIGTSAAKPIQFLNGGAVRVTIDTAGNLLLGSGMFLFGNNDANGLKLGITGVGTGLTISNTLAVSIGGSLSVGSGLGVTGNSAFGGNIQASTDNAYDLGASGSFRFRNLFLGGSATMGGGITVTSGGASITGTITLTGAVSTGGVTTIGSTLMASSDNSFDIGQAASNRFRSLYLAANATLGGTLSVAGTFLFNSAGLTSVAANTGPNLGLVPSGNATQSTATWFNNSVVGSAQYGQVAVFGVGNNSDFKLITGANAGTAGDIVLSPRGIERVRSGNAVALTLSMDSSVTNVFTKWVNTEAVNGKYWQWQIIGGGTAQSLVLNTNNTIGNALSIDGPTGTVTHGNNTAAGIAIVLNAAAANNRDVQFQTAGLLRWIVRAGNDAESGANAGSSLQIVARDDTGGTIDQPFTIGRAAGSSIGFNRSILASGSTETRISYTNTSGPNSWATAVGGGAQLAIGYFGISTSSVYTAATSALVLSTSGDVLIGNATNGGRIMPFGTGKALVGLGTLSSQSGAVVSLQNSGGFLTATGGVVVFLDLSTSNTFAPTSGTATYTGINLAPVINQTGGANGITRGLYINPTLTAAADWRALEIGATTGTAIKTNGGAHVLGGNVTALTDNAFDIGASGASRFRDLNLSRNAIIGGSVLSTGAIAAGSTTLAADVQIIINTAVAHNRDLQFQTAGVNRWIFRADSSAESTLDAGSNFVLAARHDDGSQLDSPLVIVRAAGGLLSINRPTTITGATTISGATVITGATTINGGTIHQGTSTTRSGLRVLTGTTGNVTHYALEIASTADVTATGNVIGINVTPTLAAAVVTQSVFGISLANMSLGAGATVAIQYGLYINPISGATTNYALYTNTGQVSIGDSLVLRNSGATPGLFAATDNTIDIGQAAGLRFRDLFLSRNATIAGQLTTTTVAGSGYTHNTAAGVNRLLSFQTAGSLRWQMGVSGTAESGANAGSTWVWSAFDDTGTFIDQPLAILRAAGGLVVITRPVQISGSNAGIGIGQAPQSQYSIVITKTHSGSTDQRGIFCQPTFDSGATTNAIGVYSRVITAAAAFTVASAFGYFVEDAVLGAGSAITTQYGVFVSNQTKGATNYAIFTNTGLVRFGDKVQLISTMGIGTTPLSWNGLYLNQTLTGLADQRGIISYPTFDSGATTRGIALNARVNTAAAAYTMTSGYGLYIETPSKGAGSTITTAFGIFIADQTAGTTNFAIQTGLGTVSLGDKLIAGTDNSFDIGASGANRFRDLFLARNAAIGGNMIVGGQTTAPHVGLNITSALTSSTGQFGVASQVTVDSGATAAAYGFYSRPATIAATFTLAAAYGLHVADWIKGAGSTITTQYGVYVANQTQGAANYAIFVAGANDVVLAGSGVVLPTGATTGFPYIPTCAGAPTGVPANTGTGRVPMVYDTTNNKLWIYNGGWKGAVLA